MSDSIANCPVAIVTGGSRGIGRGIAVELGRLGYAVVINYLRRSEAANETVAAVKQAGGDAMTVQADVAVSDLREHLVNRTLAVFGRVDLLVNNAAISSPDRKDLLDATEENWDRVLATNLKAPFFLSQRVAQEMIRLRAAGAIACGKLINIASLSSYTASVDRAEYCIAKAGLSMMTALFAARLAEENITVFEIRPGIVATDMTASVRDRYDREIAEGLTPIRRWGRPEDVAKAVAAIAQDYFPFSTGECLNVDGGFHIRRL